MPAPFNTARSRRHGPGDRPSKPPTKHSYSPDLNLTDDHPCAPSIPLAPVFIPSEAETWSRSGTPGPPFHPEHHGPSPEWEHPPQLATPPTANPGDTKSQTTTATTHAELTRLSARAYALRASDPTDFASAWETSIVPRLTDLLQKHCPSDFAVDVHNFPERSSEAVPRVIFITLSGGSSSDITSNDTDTSTPSPLLEATIQASLAQTVPPQFQPLTAQFRRGSTRRSNTTNSRSGDAEGFNNSWWGETEGMNQDSVCEPKNVTYRPSPIIGMSIGPAGIHDGAASLGGFVRVGSSLYAMSAFHAFEQAYHACRPRVTHPAVPDLPLLVPPDPAARPYGIGSVAMCTPLGTLKSSLTFEGCGFSPGQTMVEMDWCLIGPVEDGRNVVSVPCFQMDRCVAVEREVRVEGNTEVYATARTSGYSLGFTSDVPGLQRFKGQLTREWTVRQYSPFGDLKDSSEARAPWQTVKQWYVASGVIHPHFTKEISRYISGGAVLVTKFYLLQAPRRERNEIADMVVRVTSGIGVPGDSGAWLIRRSDNALMGLIWGRNYIRGDPLERVRLTYFTPMVDILADVREHAAADETVALPVYSARPSTHEVEVCNPHEVVPIDMSQDPWTAYAREAIWRHHQSQADLIQNYFADDEVPVSGTELVPSPNTALSVPELFTSSSAGSDSSSAGESSELSSIDNGVHVVSEGDADTIDTDEPIRSKAIFTPNYPEGLIKPQAGHPLAGLTVEARITIMDKPWQASLTEMPHSHGSGKFKASRGAATGRLSVSRVV